MCCCCWVGSQTILLADSTLSCEMHPTVKITIFQTNIYRRSDHDVGKLSLDTSSLGSEMTPDHVNLKSQHSICFRNRPKLSAIH